jgi:hypothetical protein
MKHAMAAVLMTAGYCTASAAAESVDIRITGTIQPPACSITVNGGAEHIFDYGNISRESLSGGPVATLPRKTAGLSITCSAPTQVAIRSSDGRNGSNPFSAYDWAANSHGSLKGGLGWSNGKPIGAYSLRVLPGSVDAEQSRAISRGAAADPNWSDADAEGALLNVGTGFGDVEVSWATGEESVPAAGKVFNGTVVVEPVIDTAQLDTTDEVMLDGQSTIEIVYL